MNTKIFSSILFLFSIILVAACDKDDDNSTEYEYHAHIESPDTNTKNIGDTLDIEIEFESHSGKPVHHINVSIYNKADSTKIVYNQPTNAHVMETDGAYTWSDIFVLSEANGISANSDWVLKAKVWGETTGEGEETETVEFHVHQ
ncbi:MAG: hypothetical protein IPL35_08600 [Sphingobacteriales bacterium]|nr:hypothetical protein [Sphingobacteriales bacterium]